MTLVQKALVGQNFTTVQLMYKCMERELKGDANAEFLQQANLVEICTVVNCTDHTYFSSTCVTRPETVHVEVSKETQDNESTNFHYQVHTAN